MKTKTVVTKTGKKMKNKAEEEEDLDGYPIYPPTEDIYGNYEKAADVNPEDTRVYKKRTTHKIMEKFLSDDPEDLDIPGAELDDDQEIIGSEDEENNYYSIGGDNHNDLEEDND
jgi:hypothetical protein